MSGVRVVWHGLEHIDYSASTIGMFTHASNLDPFVVASGPLAFKWIGKKSLFRIPVIGWLLTGLQHISIDRSHREKAIESLRRAAEIVVRERRCIAVSPEGTRSRTGRLADFKKGAFHTAMQVGVPITPLLVEGAYDLWPSGALFALPGTVHVYVLQPIPVGKGDSYNSLASTVRRACLDANLQHARHAQAQEKALGRADAAREQLDSYREPQGDFHFGLAFAFAPAFYAAAFFAIKAIAKVLIGSSSATSS